MEIYVLLGMVFCHIIDDFLLQQVLAKLKQKDWWKEQKGYSDFYRFDYIAGLVCHAFEWTFMMMLPWALYLGFDVGGWFLVLFIVNWVEHAVVDDLKANKMKLNLCQDQLLHVMQIVVTYVCLYASYCMW